MSLYAAISHLECGEGEVSTFLPVQELDEDIALRQFINQQQGEVIYVSQVLLQFLYVSLEGNRQVFR